MWRFVVTLILCMITISFIGSDNPAHAKDNKGRLITLYDRGEKHVFLTKKSTVGEALKAVHIQLDVRDTVEPSITEKLVATNYRVNIYRARPVVVVDGAIRIKTISSHQTAQQIAQDVGITIYPEDVTTLQPLTDFVTDGAGLQLTIVRATTVTIDLYGKKTDVRTQAKTVGDLLSEKSISLGTNGRLSIPKSTLISSGLEIRIWREGIQTISVDQEIPSSSQIVYNADQPIGYRAVQTAGIAGIRSITFQVNIKDGIEISRVEIASIITRTPTPQTEVIGIKNNGSGLTKAKGAQYFTDSKGVSHRETYYDLDMSAVMQSCGQGGHYSIRPDGAKVDAQGYIIIAANYTLYPKCSYVETSLGTGKVYDTGGFAARIPNGFDIATDWSRADGI